MRDVKWAVVKAWAERRIEERRDALECGQADPDFARGEIASLRALLALSDALTPGSGRDIQANDIVSGFERPSDMI